MRKDFPRRSKLGIAMLLGGIASCAAAVGLWVMAQFLSTSGPSLEMLGLAVVLPVLSVAGLYFIAAGVYELLKGRFYAFTDPSGLQCKIRGRWLSMHWNDITRVEIHTAPGARSVFFVSMKTRSWLMLGDEFPIDALLEEVRGHVGRDVIVEIPHASVATFPPFSEK